MKLFLKISNLCNHNTSTLRTYRQTDRRHAIAIPRFVCTKVHRAVKTDEKDFTLKVPTNCHNEHVHATGRKSDVCSKRLYQHRNRFSKLMVSAGSIGGATSNFWVGHICGLRPTFYKRFYGLGPITHNIGIGDKQKSCVMYVEFSNE